MGKITSIEPIRLLYSQKDSEVVIVPEDEDRFVVSVEDAIIACRIHEQFKTLFQKQLNHLNDLLGKWLQGQCSKVYKAFLTLQDARMLFLVVMKEKQYDSQLEDQLTDIELSIAQDPECSQIDLDVQSLPLCGEDCYTSFCNPEWVLEYKMQ